MPLARNRAEQAQSSHDMSASPQATRPICASLLQLQTSSLHHHASTGSVFFCHEYSSRPVPLRRFDVESPQRNSVSETVIRFPTSYEPVANSLASAPQAVDSSLPALALRCDQTPDSATTECHMGDKPATLINLEDNTHEDLDKSKTASPFSSTGMPEDDQDDEDDKLLFAFPLAFSRHTLHPDLERCQSVFDYYICGEIGLTYFTVCLLGFPLLGCLLYLFFLDIRLLCDPGFGPQHERIYVHVEIASEMFCLLALLFGGTVVSIFHGFGYLNLYMVEDARSISNERQLSLSFHIPATLALCSATYFTGVASLCASTIIYLKEKPSFRLNILFALIVAVVTCGFFTRNCARDMSNAVRLHRIADQEICESRMKVYDFLSWIYVILIPVTFIAFFLRVFTGNFMGQSPQNGYLLASLSIAAAETGLMTFTFPFLSPFAHSLLLDDEFDDPAARNGLGNHEGEDE